MPTYAYKQTSGSTTVEYNITPDFTTGFNLTGSVTVTGRIMDTKQRTLTLSAKLSTSTSGGSNYMASDGYINATSGGANAWAKFSITLTNKSAGVTAFPTSTQAAKVYLKLDAMVSTGSGSAGYAVGFTPVTAQSGYLFNWHTSAHIADGSGIVRCDGNGIQRPDGNRLRFENFQVLTHASSTLTRIRFEVIQSGASSGSTKDATTSTTPTISRLTSSPYTESTPSFFPSTITLNSAYSYTILISFTDAYETTQQSIGIPRGAPILDFSLAKNGGLAVGQYSSSTDTEPRFEVAYPTYLAGGLVLTPGETRGTKSGQLMMTGIRFGRHKFSKAVGASSRADETITLSPAFGTNKYVVLLTPMGDAAVDCGFKVHSQTASSFIIRYDNYSSRSNTPVMGWLAIEGSTADSSDLTEEQGGGTTPTYPENILRGTGSPSAPQTNYTNGKWSEGKWYKSGSAVSSATVPIITVSGGVDSGISKAYSITSSGGNLDLGQFGVPFAQGQQYTISCWLRVPSGSTTFEAYVYDRTAAKTTSQIFDKVSVTGTSWQHKHATFTFSGDTANSSVHFGIASAGSLDLCGFKLEKGSNSNPTWTASPKD